MKTANEYITLLRSFMQQHSAEYGITLMGILLRLRKGLNSLLLKRIEQDAVFA